MSMFESETGDRYGLVWKDHPEEVFERCKTEIPTLKMINNRSIWATDTIEPVALTEHKAKLWAQPHILIEGDNYHALKVLEFTHRGMIDVIYIDPPYNTGNKDFMYNDKFVEKEDCYRHSKWLSFMYKRLLLARELLSDTGVMFISIDDNEQAQLKLLCDKVFGEENFIASIVWQRKHGRSSLAKNINKVHEYILVYRKSDLAKLSKLPLAQKTVERDYKNPDNDARGVWTTKPLWADTNKNKHTDLILPGGTKRTERWVVKQETFDALYNDGRIFWTNKGIPRKKIYLSEHIGIVSDTWWENNGTTTNATIQLRQMFNGKHLFDTAKPIELIKKILNISESGKNSTVLDFFAGSGTTGHAVLEMNKEDAGNRQFILCTNDENKICTEVCYPRLKKVIEGYKTPKGKVIEGIPANLVYFTCGRNKEGSSAFMPLIENSDPDTLKLELAQHSTGIIKTIEGTYIEESKSYVKDLEDLEYMFLRNGGKKEHGNKYVGIYYSIYENGLEKLLDRMNGIKNKNIEKILYYFELGDTLGNISDPKRWGDITVKKFPKEFFDKFLTTIKKGNK